MSLTTIFGPKQGIFARPAAPFGFDCFSQANDGFIILYDHSRQRFEGKEEENALKSKQKEQIHKTIDLIHCLWERNGRICIQNQRKGAN